MTSTLLPHTPTQLTLLTQRITHWLSVLGYSARKHKFRHNEGHLELIMQLGLISVTSKWFTEE